MRRRLAREHHQALLHREIRQVAACRHGDEGADAHHVRLLRRTARLDDLGARPRHTAALGHLALHLVPEPFQLRAGGQLLARRQRAQELLPVGKLEADQRLRKHGRRVARHLTGDAEQLSEIPGALLQQRVEVVDLLVVGVVLGGQLLAVRLRGLALRLGLREQRRLLIAVGLELPLAVGVLPLLLLVRGPSLFQQLVQAPGSEGARRQSEMGREQRDPDVSEAIHGFTSFAACTVVGACTGAHKRSGAPCFLATRIASRTSCA